MTSRTKTIMATGAKPPITEERAVKQEKLCEAEDMMPEELGAANNMYVAPEELEKFRKQFNLQQIEEHQRQIKEKVRISGDSSEWEKKVIANSRQIGGQHYKKMDIQPWDVIDYGPKQQAIGFYRYNALKYIMRAGEKGDFKEDIAKAQHYLEKLLEFLE